VTKVYDKDDELCAVEGLSIAALPVVVDACKDLEIDVASDSLPEVEKYAARESGVIPKGQKRRVGAACEFVFWGGLAAWAPLIFVWVWGAMSPRLRVSASSCAFLSPAWETV